MGLTLSYEPKTLLEIKPWVTTSVSRTKGKLLVKKPNESSTKKYEQSFSELIWLPKTLSSHTKICILLYLRDCYKKKKYSKKSLMHFFLIFLSHPKRVMPSLLISNPATPINTYQLNTYQPSIKLPLLP
jgi:hypothetical protein